MTMFFGPHDVERAASFEFAVGAMRHAFEAEADGTTNLPVRLNASSPTGFIRVMPAVLNGVMGVKIMTLVEDLGTRYLVLLYSAETGELLALLDADELTRIRTAATTLLAAQLMVAEPPTALALVGTGFEATGHLTALAQAWPLQHVSVYSRSADRRESFAAQMTDQLGIDVHATATVRDAVREAAIVVLATKSTTPVVNGDEFLPDSVVLSIGSTRPDLRELDERAFQRAKVVVVDAFEQVVNESGDVVEALAHGAISQDLIVPLADLCAGGALHAPDNQGRDLLVFKSAGTALQDLALAHAIFRHASDGSTNGDVGRDVGELTRLKPFA